MSAKEYLQQIRRWDRQIAIKQAEIERLESMATSVTARLSADKVTTSGSESRLADCVADIVDLQNKLADAVKTLVALKREAMDMIDTLDWPYCEVLHSRYFEGAQWEQIALDLGRTYQWTCILHGRALQKIEKLIIDRN